MASTLTLQQIVSWAQTFTKMVPIIGVGGFGEEPALSICNDVIQEILSEPYNWKWNQRVLPGFTTSTETNQQDYTTTVTDLAWIESCTVVNPLSTQQPQPTYSIAPARTLQPSSQLGNPQRISFQYETDEGGTLRLYPVPNLSQPWVINLVYQAKPITKTDLSQFWNPIPDELGYVIRKGFLAMAYKQADDARYEAEYREFVRLIRKAVGYNDMEEDAEGYVPDSGLFMG